LGFDVERGGAVSASAVNFAGTGGII